MFCYFLHLQCNFLIVIILDLELIKKFQYFDVSFLYMWVFPGSGVFSGEGGGEGLIHRLSLAQ
jgi:hypothetical protein